jgi:pyrrolidone-carboxylate peptidase
MKALLLLLIVPAVAWGKPLIVIGFFDAFGAAPFNNSERVARALEARLKESAAVDVRTCGLETVFDRSLGELEDCVRELPEPPALVLSLGETGCNLKVEIMGRNVDDTFGPDNSGIERKATPIAPDGPRELGLRYPLAEMYCALAPNERNRVVVSNDAGSFVCNNLAYQYAARYPEQSFGFIHVPAHDCRNLDRRTDESVRALEKMILAAAAAGPAPRFPVRRAEFQVLRERHRGDRCRSEFYKRTKGADEKGFWTLLAPP